MLLHLLIVILSIDVYSSNGMKSKHNISQKKLFLYLYLLTVMLLLIVLFSYVIKSTRNAEKINLIFYFYYNCWLYFVLLIITNISFGVLRQHNTKLKLKS